jgi:hypothetical protein
MKGLADQHLARHRGLPEGRRRQLFLNHSRRAGLTTTEDDLLLATLLRPFPAST